ncbi:T9SS type A sorting domain-containing protein [Fulvivirgaceae bacterium BMA10]|uniref:T9SS type A sorting domain-containing protein n=1 Tax=Splendidivirga corallicola TaxID=3051826 RepID=A0ABT8KXG7_9BACT|nr:T9SS type A sorting domain-containing protein [Fulvivirgaceae bacterium BMA10]
MSKISIALFFLLLSVYTSAQDIVWVKSFGGINDDIAFATVVLDDNNNSYLTGTFSGSIELGSENNKHTLSAVDEDIFIVKLDPDGEVVWVNSLDYGDFDNGTGLAVNTNGEIYLSGILDDESNVGLVLTITKLSPEGNPLWNRQIPLDDYSFNGLAIDDKNNIYVTGGYFDPIEFNIGSENLALTPVGNADMFLLKLNESGELVWIKIFGNSDALIGGISVKTHNNSVYIHGLFQGTVDMNPGSGIFNLTASGFVDSYIVGLDTDGNFERAINLLSGKFETDRVTSFTLDSDNNIYTTGFFSGSADLFPGGQSMNHQSNGASDIFIQKLSPQGSLLLSKSLGGMSDDSGVSIEVDTEKNMYITGGFSDDMNVGSEENEEILIPENDTDLYILKLNEDGDFKWAKTFQYTYATSRVNYEQEVFTSGFFEGSVDFEDTDIETIVSNGDSDFYVQKIISQDGGGGQNNSPKVENPIMDLSLTEGFGTNNINISSVFLDSDGDDLNLSASSSDESVVTAAISESTLILTEVGVGNADISVIADDGKGGTVNDSFTVEIKDRETITSINALSSDNNIAIFPNPADDILIITFNDNGAVREPKVEFYDFLGKRYSVKLYKSSDGLKIDLAGIGKGTYIAKVITKEASKIEVILIK